MVREVDAQVFRGTPSICLMCDASSQISLPYVSPSYLGHPCHVLGHPSPGSACGSSRPYHLHMVYEQYALCAVRRLLLRMHVSQHCSCPLHGVNSLQNSRRHLLSLQSPNQDSVAGLQRLKPHLHQASLLICSHLFWPKVPDADLELRMPGVQTSCQQMAVKCARGCCNGLLT